MASCPACKVLVRQVKIFCIKCGCLNVSPYFQLLFSSIYQTQAARPPPPGYLGPVWLGMYLLASQNLYPIIIYFMANYRPHLSHFWANAIVISRTEFNASRLLNIKTTAVFLNPCLPEFSYPRIPKNVRPHSSNSAKNVTPL